MRARKTAVAALVAQQKQGYSNLVLKGFMDRNDLSLEEKALCSRIFYGTIERKYTLDHVLKHYIQKPLSKLDDSVYCILSSACYQILFMGTAQHAVVNEAVKITRAFGKSSACGLVNAVLRKICENGKDHLDFSNADDRLSLQYSIHPSIVRLLEQAYPGKAESILNSFFIRPALSVRVNTLLTTSEQLAGLWQKHHLDFRPGIVPNSYFISNRGSPVDIPGFREGLFQVQGQASQFAALCLDVKPGDKVLDLCAAPGGKTAVLAQTMQNQGSLFSCELHENRLDLIRQNLKRQKVLNTKVMQNDACIFNINLTGAQRVLCDVPCSGIGVIAKKPDIRYKNANEFADLPAIQQKILSTGAMYVQKGGSLVYSTCTLNPAENEEVISAFIKTHSDFSVVKVHCPFDHYLETEYGLTIFPYDGLTDGFFICKLVRNDDENNLI